MSKERKTEATGTTGSSEFRSYAAAPEKIDDWTLAPGSVASPTDALTQRIRENELAIAALRQLVFDLERRLDHLFRWTVGDRTGYRYPVPNFALGRAKSHPGVFPEPDYETKGGPRKPQGEP